MKNPFMSLWLSNANRALGVGRGMVVPPLDSETPDCDYAASGMVSIRSRRNWAGERWPCRSISQLSL